MRVTKALLIEKGDKLGLSLNSKMKLAEMQTAIDTAEAELNALKIGDLVKTTRVLHMCGCSSIPKNTVMRVTETTEMSRYVRAASYPNQTRTLAYIRKEDLAKVNPEKLEEAENAFKKANSYTYATID